jgi:hypothetical protein
MCPGFPEHHPAIPVGRAFFFHLSLGFIFLESFLSSEFSCVVVWVICKPFLAWPCGKESFSDTFPARDLTEREKLACYGVGLVSCPELLLTVGALELIVIVHFVVFR